MNINIIFYSIFCVKLWISLQDNPLQDNVLQTVVLAICATLSKNATVVVIDNRE